jgi:PKD repeat protein
MFLPLAFQGNIAEIILFDTIINSDFKTDINNYLHDKYAPPVNLGTDTVSGNSFCDSITLDAGNRFVTYNWSNGSTSRYARVSLNNSYSITAKDIFGRESTDDILVYPYARLNNMTTFICQGDTFKVDLKTPAGFTALWNTGATTTKLNISASGQYTVKVTDGSGCFVYDTINVVIDAPNLSPAPDLSNNLRVCLNEKLFLATSTAYDSIRWSTGSTDNFIAITAPGPYTVYGRTTAGCIINKSFNVTIAGEAPVAKFVNSSICQNAQTAFTDSSTSSVSSTITNWKWTFGDNNTSVLKNPNNTYTNLGTYTVGFKVTTNQGCSDSISKTIIVNRKPSPSFFNLLSCAGVATTFVDQSVANAAAITNWNWDFAGLGHYQWHTKSIV